MSYKYAWDNFYIYWSSKEATFNTPTNTTTNLAADTYYWFPMAHQNKVWVRRVRRPFHQHISGYTDEGLTGHEGYEPLELTLTGPMFNLDMLYFMCKHCDTSGASAPYTHDTITTDARLMDCSFPILVRQENAGADVIRLFTGCIIKRWYIDWEQNQQAILTMVIELGREWAGTALNTWPSKPNLPYGPSAITTAFKKGGSAYTGYMSKFHFEWNDNAKLDFYDAEAADYSYGPRSIFIEFDWVPKTQTDWTDSQDKTNFDAHNRDIDIDLEFVRTADNDEVKINMEKLCWIAPPTTDFTHNDYYEKRHYKMGMDSDETGYKTTITQKDSNDATRFEGS